MNPVNRFPPGWDEDRTQNVIFHYDSQTEEEALMEDETMFESPTRTVMEIPRELVASVRELLAQRSG